MSLAMGSCPATPTRSKVSSSPRGGRAARARAGRAALVQTKWTGDTASMVDVHEKYAREAAEQGAQIMGFQEVFNARYFCQVQEAEHYKWAEPVPDGPTVPRMQALAKELGMVDRKSTRLHSR